MFRYLFTYIIRGMPILATDLLRHPTSKFLRQIPQQNSMSSPQIASMLPNPQRLSHFRPKETWHTSFPPSRRMEV